MVLPFQSTRPVWGATDVSFAYDVEDVFQSTRPVWGATQELLHIFVACEFQSTRPVWGATSNRGKGDKDVIVSIHAPRVGRDQHAG